MAKFNLAEKQDFLSSQDLAEFRIIESAGAILPVYEIKFHSSDEDLLPLLNEGNIIQVSMGRTLNDLKDTELFISKCESTLMNNERRAYSIVGMINSTKFISQDIYYLKKATSTSVIQEIMAPYFNVINEAAASKDEMTWICPTNSPKKFLNKLLIHSYIPGSFLLSGITIGNEFVLKDMNTLKNQEYTWRFTETPTDESKDIVPDADNLLSSNTGFINSWQGYGRKRTTLSMKDNTEDNLETTIQKTLSLSATPNRSSEFSQRQSLNKDNSPNTHSNYWSAYSNNLGNLSVLGSNTIQLSFASKFRDIKVLDLVMVKDRTNKPDKQQSLFYTSGLYVVSKVTRAISGNVFITIVDLCRENMNSTTGNLR